MLSRRSFFKAISTAVLGTAIALKIPDALIHVPKLDYNPNCITWPMLNRLYEELKQKHGEPHSHIMLATPHRITYKYIRRDEINWV